MSHRRHFQFVRRLSNPVNSYTYRTHNCGELTKLNEGQNVRIMGWLAYKRMNRFIILRDSYGIVQGKIDPSSAYSDVVKELPYESVIEIRGIVKSRGENSNPKMETGEIEVDVSTLTVLNKANTSLPLDPDGKANEKTRMLYRYLDIRGKKLQRALRIRSRLVHEMRKFLIDKRGFVDVETPTLFRRTPGGAAEFVVPAPAPNQGSCYSLPQSPQQFKQLLMVGGIDRYFQVARCYRDEGSKGDRQPEFTQIDLEMSFVDQDGVMRLVEDLLISSWPEHLADLKPSAPFPRLKFEDAVALYGSDKPDMRISWKIQDCSPILRDVLNKSDLLNWCCRLIVCKNIKTVNNSTKKEWTRLIEMNKLGTKFAVYSPQAKNWFKAVNNSIIMDQFDIGEDDVVIFAWGHVDSVQWTLGQLRNYVAEYAGLRQQRKITCHWVVDFPLFTNEDNKLVSSHHPFTAAVPEHQDWLKKGENLEKITGQHYDLVINGVEMGGGSIRIHNADEQRLVLQRLGESPDELNHLLEALANGAPPHGGFALGLDRYTALMAASGDPTVPVRDVIAFPKTKEGRDLMCGAPVQPSEEQLKRYGISLISESKS